MDIGLDPIPFPLIKARLVEHLSRYAVPVDNYYEDHVIESKHYELRADGARAGYLSIFEGGMLTQFSLDEGSWNKASAVFDAVLKLGAIETIYASTADALFASLALDSMKKAEAQDFVYECPSGWRGDPGDSRLVLRRASMGDVEEIRKRDDGFLSELERNIGEEALFIGAIDGEILSFGLVEKSKLFPEMASLGLFVVKERRGQGLGVMTLRSLIAACRAGGIRPIAGCFARNLASRGALEKAGMFSRARLLKIEV